MSKPLTVTVEQTLEPVSTEAIDEYVRWIIERRRSGKTVAAPPVKAVG